MSVKGKAKAAARTVGMAMDAAERKAEDYADGKFDESTMLGRAGQTGTVLTVVTLGIVMIIGTLIYSQVEQSLPQPQNNELDNASGNVTEGFADAMNLAPVILIVLLAAVVLAVVQRFR
jgi:hypothetical protein